MAGRISSAACRPMRLALGILFAVAVVAAANAEGSAHVRPEGEAASETSGQLAEAHSRSLQGHFYATPAPTPAAPSNEDALSTTGAHEEHDVHEEHGAHAHQHDVIFFLFNGILIATLVVHATTYIHRLSWVQPTVATFALGMTYSLVIELTNSENDSGIIGRSYGMWMRIDPHVLLFTMLPLLLTGDAMNIDTSVARMVSKQCLYLAGPGVFISCILTAFFLNSYLPYDWPMLLCLTIGAILAATDPVAVVSLLKELGASPILTVQIQGESLLNDGVAIVVFTMAYEMLKGTTFDAKDIIVFILKVVLCAWILGAAIGAVFTMWIRAASNRLEHSSSMIQISLTLCCAYVSFFVAEGIFHISGVLSTVAASLVLADNMWTSIVHKDAMHEVWHVFEYFGNTVIFFLSGGLTARSMVNIPYKDYFYLCYIYVILTLVRGGLLLASRPILKMLSPDRTPVSIGNALVMTWGGLRGAVGLSLAVIVNVERADGKLTQMDADRVLFYTGGIACLTLLLNATTCPHLVDWLGLTQTTSTKKHVLRSIFQQMRKLSAHAEYHSEGVGSLVEEKLAEIEHTICPEGLSAWMQAEKAGYRSDEIKENKQQQKEEGGIQAVAREFMMDDDCQHLSGEQVASYLRNSKSMFNMVKDNIGLLGKFEDMPLKDINDKVKVCREQTPDYKLLTALNEAFLTLVRAQYWTQIEHGFYAPGTSGASLCLKSISHALHHAYKGLTDLEFIEHEMQLKELLPRPFVPPPQKKKGWADRLMEWFDDKEQEERAQDSVMPADGRDPNGINPDLYSPDIYMSPPGSPKYVGGAGGAGAFNGESIAEEPDESAEQLSPEAPALGEPEEPEQGTEGVDRPMRRRHSLLKTTSSIQETFVSLDEKQEPPLKKFINSMQFGVVVGVAILSNIVLIVLEDTTSSSEADKLTPAAVMWLSCDILYLLFFLSEFLLKFYVLRRKYFTDGWNIFDFSCLVLAGFSLVIKLLVLSSAASSGAIPSEAELLRANRVLRLARIFRAATLFRLFRTLQVKYQDRRTTLSTEVGKSMDIIQAMSSVAHAHIRAQHEFLKYFGEDGNDLTSIEEIQVMLESRTCVYIALTRAAHEAAKFPNFMQGLRVLNETTDVTSHMSHYMHHALESGIISKREAETISTPLKKHEKVGDTMRADAHMGICHPYVETLRVMQEGKTEEKRMLELGGIEVDDVSPERLQEWMLELMNTVTKPGFAASASQIKLAEGRAETLLQVLGDPSYGPDVVLSC